MKAICDRKVLLESLNTINGAIVARTPKPVLTCVKITAVNDALTLAATDLELTVRVTTPHVEIQEQGDALVPADKLRQIVSELTDPTLILETEKDLAHIRAQDSHYKMFVHSMDDFPPLPEFEGEPDFEIAAPELHKLISQTIFATARESSRYAINGVLVERDGKKLVMVATDGRRLAMAKGSCKQAKGDNRSAIVPTKALKLILQMFQDGEQTVRVRIADNQIMFATDDAFLTSNLVEGNFPPFKDVVPRDNDRKAKMDTDILASAVRRAALLTNEESKGVRMTFAEDGLKLTSRTPEMGEAEVSAEMPEFDGEPIEIGFNPQFITDALKVVDSEQISIELKAPNKPGLMRTDSDFLYVIMPVNLE